MSLPTLRWTTLLSLLLISLSGCGFLGRGASDDDDVDLTEMDSEKASPLDGDKNEFAMESLPEERQLELKLTVGSRFPLQKRVETRLTQSDKSGVTVNTTLTEMMLSLVVDEVAPDGRKQLTARFHRVQYQQDIGGKQIAYSSDRRAESVPPEAMLYDGLANNSFSFRLGPDNKIVELIGFNDFLHRCLRNIPAQYAGSVRQQLEATKSEDGIANFIDESIGLLPYSNDPAHPAVAVKEGSTWDLQPRRIDVPIPLLVTTKCMLKQLAPEWAEITMSGKISGPPGIVTMYNDDGEMKVFIRGGNCTGSCRVDRTTGLPTQSQIRRYMEMIVRTPDGQEIQQNKETVSTITSFLEQNSKPVQSPVPQPTAQASEPAANSEDQTLQQTNFLKNVMSAEAQSQSRRPVGPAGSRPKF